MPSYSSLPFLIESKSAFSSVFPPQLASALVSFIILAFCLSTQIGFFVYYETSAINVLGKKSMTYMRWLYLIPGVVFAGFSNVDKLWTFANISVGVCAIPNLIAVLALSGVFFVLMRDYLQGQNKYVTDITDREKNYVRQCG